MYTCRVLITATDIKEFPSKLVFFNNFEEGSGLGKGMFKCIWACVYAVFKQISMFGKLLEQLVLPQYISNTLEGTLTEELRPTTPAWMEWLKYTNTIKGRATSMPVWCHWVVGPSIRKWNTLMFMIVGLKLED